MIDSGIQIEVIASKWQYKDLHKNDNRESFKNRKTVNRRVRNSIEAESQ